MLENKCFILVYYFNISDVTPPVEHVILAVLLAGTDLNAMCRATLQSEYLTKINKTKKGISNKGYKISEKKYLLHVDEKKKREVYS